MREVVIGITTALGILAILWVVGLIGTIPDIIAIPRKAVIAFDSKECPSEGWEEYKLAYGRFVRGIDRSDPKVDPDGERSPGSLQEDMFKKHIHEFNAARSYNGENGRRSRAKHSGRDDTTESTGGAETRPKNVALLYCVKL